MDKGVEVSKREDSSIVFIGRLKNKLYLVDFNKGKARLRGESRGGCRGSEAHPVRVILCGIYCRKNIILPLIFDICSKSLLISPPLGVHLGSANG